MPKKVLIVSAYIPPKYSGAGKASLSIAKHLQRNDELLGILTETDSEEKVPLWTISRTQAGVRGFITQFVQILKLIYHLRDQIKTIHSFNPSSWISFSSILSGRLLNIPTITEITLIGSDDPQTFLKERRYHGFIGLSMVGHINCLSPALLSRVTHFKQFRSKALNIPRSVELGVNVMGQQLPEREFNRGKIHFLFAGAFMKRKGSDVIMHMLPELINRYPEGHFTFLFGVAAKEEDASDLAALKMLAKQSSSWFTFKENVSDMGSYYQEADILLLPSRAEGLPNVVLEGMSYGVIPVVNLIPGITDTIIVDRVEGHVIPENDPAEFLNRIQACTEDYQVFEKLGSAARRKIEKKYDRDEVMQRYQRIYNS